MRKSFLIILFIIYNSLAYSQKKASMPSFKGKKLDSLYHYFLNEMDKKEDNKSFDKVCLQTVCFIKFKVDAEGVPIDIVFNYGSDSLFNNIFKQILINSKQYWKPSFYKNKPCVSNQILIPVILLYDKGCPLKHKIDYYHFKKAVFNITNYTNEEYARTGALEDCIISEPFIFTSSIPWEDLAPRKN